jgi:adenosine kinase
MSGLLGMGNPLLDISVECEMDLLDKYGLKLNNAILAAPEHLPLYKELVEKFPTTVQYIAGGATQNSIRVAQWMHGEKGFSAYAGCIGNDEFGKQLQAAAEADGVTTYYDHEEGVPTGTCAVLVHLKERSLVANLSAAEKYSKSRHFDTEAFQAVVKGTKIIYSAGFFLTHASETMLACGKIAAENPNQRYAINLSAPFLCQFFKDQMLSVMPYADFVFGNESEAAAFAEANGYPAGLSVAEIAKRIAALPKANSKPRVVVITQGSESTIIAQSDKASEEPVVVPVDKMESHLIVDTNGAGDAFVGGFLAHVAKGASYEQAASAGHWAAGHIIQRSGCTFDRSAKYVPK